MYDDLTLKEKAELIRLGVSNGIYSLKDIKDTYNKFEEDEYKETISEKMSSSLMRFINASNPFTSDYQYTNEEYLLDLNWLINEHKNKYSNKNSIYSKYVINENNKPILQLPEITVTNTKFDEGGEKYIFNDIILPKDNINVDIREKFPILINKDLPEEILKSFMSDEEYNKILKETKDKKYKILDRDLNKYFIDLVKSLQNVSIDEALKKLDTKEKIKDVQKELAESGAYDKYIPTTKEEIKKLLRRLVYLGYLKENINGKNQIDGIVGKNTIKAWRNANVDGIIGLKTKTEYENLLNKNKVDADWDIKVDGQKDYCARFVSKKASISTGTDPLTIGIYGNAWLMPLNIVKHGGKELFNIYKSKNFDKLKSGKELYNITKDYLSKNKLDYNSLQKGDIVGIFMPSSSHHEDVLKTGTTYNTHIGIIVGYDNNNKPIVEHTVGGKIFRDSIDKIKGSLYGKAQITVAVRPKYSSIDKIKLNKNAKNKFTISEEYKNPIIELFITGMSQGEEEISKIYPDVPMDIIQLIAIGVLKRETNFMTNKITDLSNLKQLEDKITLKLKGPEKKSTNTSKMKLASLSNNERTFLGIKTKEDLEDPYKAGLAAELYLAKNYDYFNRLTQQYPELGITQDDIINAVILSYNQGMGKLYNLGFDNEGNASPDKLIELRRLADKDTKIKDIKSTKYKYLGKLGEFFYDNFEESFQPYISSARQAMRNNIIKKE